MYHTRASTICRLCLCSGHYLVDVLEEGSSAGFDVKTAIEELLRVEVVKEALYPWKVCSGCLEKLTGFNYFKRRCIENQEVYDKRVKKLNFDQGRTECDKVKSEEDEGPEETPCEVACWDCGHLEGYQPQTGVDGNDIENPLKGAHTDIHQRARDSKEGILDVGGPHSPEGVSPHRTWTNEESTQQAALFTGEQGPGGIHPWILHSRQRASGDNTLLVTSVCGEEGAPYGSGAIGQEIDEGDVGVNLGTRMMDGITSPISPSEEEENSEAVTLLKSEPSDSQMMGRRRENNSETMEPTDEANGRLGVEGHGPLEKLVMSENESVSGKRRASEVNMKENESVTGKRRALEVNMKDPDSVCAASIATLKDCCKASQEMVKDLMNEFKALKESVQSKFDLLKDDMVGELQNELLPVKLNITEALENHDKILHLLKEKQRRSSPLGVEGFLKEPVRIANKPFVLPAGSWEELLQVEMEIATNPDSFEYLVAFFLEVKSKDLGKWVRKNLERSVTNDLARLTNWSGKQNKVCFSSSFPKFIEALHVGAKVDPSHVGNFDCVLLEVEIKKWLRNARGRKTLVPSEPTVKECNTVWSYVRDVTE